MASATPSTVAPVPPELSGSARPPTGLRDHALLLPGLLVLACGAVLGIFDAGYAKTVWYPVALFLLALAVLVLIVAPPSRAERSRWFDLAVVSFGLYTLWSFASMLWADVPGDAWEGANRTLLFWLAFTVVGLRPWSARMARAAIALVAFGVGAIAAGLLVVTATKANPADLLLIGRLSEPVGYANATANLWLIAFFPAVQVALTRELALPVRVLGLAVATLLLETALLSQSRGAVGGFAIAIVVFLLLHPRRWQALAAIAVPLALTALGWDALTAVRSVADSGALEEALGDVRRTVVLSVAGAAALATAAIVGARLLERRVPTSASARRRGDQAFLGIAGVAAVAVVVVLAGSGGWLDERWESFKSTSYDQVESGSNRFTGALGSGRYDFWRVAVGEWRERPVAGIGADNFSVPYLEERKTPEAPRYTHSFPIGVLVQLGLVGALLFAIFAGAALAGFVGVRRRATSAEAGLAVGALAGTTVWFAHGTVDWLWEYPALSLLALGLLALAGRTGRGSSGAAADVRRPLRSTAGRIVVALVALAAAMSLALPGAAARYERSAYDLQRTNPAATLDRLERAARLDRLNADPLIGRALLVRRMGRTGEARADLQEALRREPRNWFAHFELALLEGQARRWEEAGRSLRRAQALNPTQPVVAETGELIAKRRPIDPDEVEAVLGGQLSGRLTPFEE